MKSKGSKIPVGGRLSLFIKEWEKITDDKWVLSVIREGYKLEFQNFPPNTGIKQTCVNAKDIIILNQEVEKLLEKEAIEIVPPAEIHQGFYSTFFLVPKKTGDLRPVINLKPLNQYLRTQHFKMDCMNKVINLAKKGDWAISIDLQDAYFHIPLFPGHRKYLRFCIQGKAYQFKALAFGPKSSPRTFTKIVSVVAGYLRIQNLRLAVYLDDWFLLNAIRNQLLENRELVLNLLAQLGFIVNRKKSQLVPTQQIVYIGGLFQLDKGLVLPTPERIKKLKSAVLKILNMQVTAKDYLHMLGLMASCIEMIPYARLHMRPIQIHLLFWWRPASKNMETIIPSSSHLRQHLNWWLHPANMLKGRSLQPVKTTMTIQTDASSMGWGGMLGKKLVQGQWSEQEKKKHINLLELEAVILTVRKFLPQLRNQNVLIRSDNTTVVQYVTKQGGTKSPQLCYKAWELWKLAIDNNIELKAAHIAGRLNIVPDQLSRVVIRQTEWTMNDSVLGQIFQIWDKPFIDLFASIQNRKMEMFCSWEVHPQALATDALTISWDRMYAYAFPPICLIPKVLEHMKQFQCTLILIAPQWPRRHWYTTLLQMCVAQPIRLPHRHDLLKQPKTMIFHPNPEVFNLNAWLLSTSNSDQKAFRRKLENFWLPHGEKEPKEIIHTNSNNSIVGVLHGKLIRTQFL